MRHLHLSRSRAVGRRLSLFAEYMPAKCGSIRRVASRSERNSIKVVSNVLMTIRRHTCGLWDESRIRQERQIRDKKGAPISSWTTEIWDSSKAQRWISSATTDDYVFGEKTDEHLRSKTSYTLFNRRPHHFWWLPIDVDRIRATRRLPRPKTSN